MATIKANNSSYLLLGNKVTTPSLVVHGSGYIPLFRGNKNATVDYNRWRYTLGGLKVGEYRAAVSRYFINHAPTVTVGASSNRIANGSNVTITAYASDPDGDALTYRWNTGATGRSIVVSASNTTRSYHCTVSDPYGGSATSNTVSVEWYNPNRAPYVTVRWISPSPSFDGRVTVSFDCSDPDNDRLYFQIKTGSNRDVVVDSGYVYNTAGGQTVNRYVGLWNTDNGFNCRVQVWDTSNATDLSDRRIGKDTGWNAKYWVYDTSHNVSTGSTSTTAYWHYRTAEMVEFPHRLNGQRFWCAASAGGGDEENDDGSGTVYGIVKTGEHSEYYSYKSRTQTATSGGSGGSTDTDTETTISGWYTKWDVRVDASINVWYNHSIQYTGGFI